MILVIEDEKDVRRLIRRSLEALGHVVTEAADGRHGLESIVRQRPEVVILDLGLPDTDGMDLLVALREWSEVPVIVLSARDGEVEKVAALEAGADDYLTKPFSPAELSARIKVALRHAARAAGSGEPVLRVDGLEMDLAARRVSLDGADIHLTPIEYKLLAALMRHHGRVVTHGQIMKEVWGRHSNDGNQGLRIHMQHVREKLGDDPLSPRFIYTEPGIGYRFRMG